jgi:excisionase family DNA binding protein
MSSKALGLLREWYYRTREANFKSCYPGIAVRWEKCGLAWEEVGVGFELSRCTSPRELHAWEEAGHQFCKLDELQQALIVGNLFHGWTVTELVRASRINRHECNALIRDGLRFYQNLCLDAGIIDAEDEMPEYLHGMKSIANYLGIPVDTCERWRDKCGLPAYSSPGTGVLAKKEDLDRWFVQRFYADTSKMHQYAR